VRLVLTQSLLPIIVPSSCILLASVSSTPQVKSVMVENVGKVIDRGDKLDELGEKAGVW